ncbi:hypothetical protein MPMin1_gp19 [Microbacterium phage Min1]|uniref:Uncharacterized protein n=1 Tax=Microbacterium phage Min1 TaxID=446529 RepID=A6N1X7_9CAUD|nr:hypothetical protein MPMin1_gp19 [Microbacterium phage Min1]ABR10449.1 hypothetical protein [Microbacterium phage Min1]
MCTVCNGLAEDADAITRLDLIDRGLRVEKAATNAATLQRAMATPVESIDGERWLLLSATKRRHVSEVEACS